MMRVHLKGLAGALRRISTRNPRCFHNSAKKVAVIGSGNWGTTMARIIGSNVTRKPNMFQDEVQMYVYESVHEDGRRLSDIINTEHVNVKNLPGYVIPENVVVGVIACVAEHIGVGDPNALLFRLQDHLGDVHIFVSALVLVIANPDLVDSVKDADILVFNLPPMFLKKTCLKLKGNIKPDVLAISMIKGLDHSKKGFHLISQQIKDILNIPDVSVMMGANIAEEVAKEMFSESTIGSNSLEHGYIFKELLSMPYFKVHVISDVESVEFCGAIKNVVAIGAGIIDGLGYGDNTKAAIIRIGLEEAFEFSRAFLPGSRMSTFFESCGIADLIVTCYGGKHRLAGEAFVKTGKQFKELESVVPELRFRKLPGPDTLEAVFKVVQDKKLEKKFPLVTVLHNICFEGGSPSDIIEALQRHDEFPANL